MSRDAHEPPFREHHEASQQHASMDRLRSGVVADAAALSRMRELLSRPLTDDRLRENTALVAAPPETRASALLSLLVFRVGQERLAILADDAHRVTPCSRIRRVPHRTNHVIAGIANIGGELTPVAHLGAILGVDACASPTHFVVIGSVLARWAFAVDELEGVVRVERATLLPAPTTVRHALDGCATSLASIAYHGVVRDASDASQLSKQFRDMRDAPADRENLVTILETVRLAALFTGGLV
jgi:chemotaxis signal transduction protein